MLASASLARHGTGVAGHPSVGGAFVEHEPRLKSCVSRIVPRAAVIDDLVREVFVRATMRSASVPFTRRLFCSASPGICLRKEIRRRANHRSSSFPADFDLPRCPYTERLRTEISIKDRLDGRPKLTAWFGPSNSDQLIKSPRPVSRTVLDSDNSGKSASVFGYRSARCSRRCRLWHPLCFGTWCGGNARA